MTFQTGASQKGFNRSGDLRLLLERSTRRSVGEPQRWAGLAQLIWHGRKCVRVIRSGLQAAALRHQLPEGSRNMPILECWRGISPWTYMRIGDWQLDHFQRLGWPWRRRSRWAGRANLDRSGARWLRAMRSGGQAYAEGAQAIKTSFLQDCFAAERGGVLPLIPSLKRGPTWPPDGAVAPLGIIRIPAWACCCKRRWRSGACKTVSSRILAESQNETGLAPTG